MLNEVLLELLSSNLEGWNVQCSLKSGQIVDGVFWISFLNMMFVSFFERKQNL